jgi:hypothetical protein
MQNNLTNINTEKTTSPARIAANQANALKSTGPKTDEGRNASKLNALKHGIFSSEILVRGRHLQEKHEELAALHQRMCDDYHPVGVAEEMLVDQLVTTFWRTRRLQKAEAAEIALSVDRCVEQLQPPDPKRLQQQWQKSENVELAMAQSLEGNNLLADQLNAVRRCVVKQGELNPQAIAFVQFDGEPYELTGTLEILLEDLQQNPKKLYGNALRVWQKEQVLAFLDGQLAEIGERITILTERESAAEEAQKAAALVPSREVMDRLGLYETRLRRQFNTALTQLERMQRARRCQDASSVTSPEGVLDPLENTQTKKRTQSPSVNDHIEMVNPTPPAQSNNPAIQDSSNPASGNCPPSCRVVALAKTEASPMVASPKANLSTEASPAKENPQNMPNEKTNPIIPGRAEVPVPIIGLRPLMQNPDPKRKNEPNRHQ